MRSISARFFMTSEGIEIALPLFDEKIQKKKEQLT